MDGLENLLPLSITKKELQDRRQEFKTLYNPASKFYVLDDSVIDQGWNIIKTYVGGVPQAWLDKDNVSRFDLSKL